MSRHFRMLVGVGIVGVVALVAWLRASPPAPPAAQDMVSISAQQVLRDRPRNLEAQQRHLAIVATAAAQPQRADVPPSVETITTDGGVTSFVTIPLAWAGSDEAVQLDQAKQQLAVVVNRLFTSDPTLERVGVVGTYPLADGRESPALFVLVAQAEWRQHPALDGTTLSQVAQSFRIASELTQ